MISVSKKFNIFIYFIATIFWIISLKGVELRIAYPFTACAFFIVPTLAYLFLGESISWRTYLGGFIILVGIFVSIYE